MPSSEGTALLSSIKTSDSHLSIQLHPLVILTISDYITRHSLRQQTIPIVGAILGTQNNRTITLEQAFQCATEPSPTGSTLINGGWFAERLQQYKDVHKAPPLDLVAWFALAPKEGPTEAHAGIQKQLLETYNESVLLVAFHPEGLQGGGRLPLSVYESVFEAAAAAAPAEEGGDSRMADAEAQSLVLKFKELAYTVETGEAEMIGLNSIATGSANAALASSDTASTTNGKASASTKGKGKPTTTHPPDTETTLLTPEEDDAIATLTSKANAIRMLSRRLSLLQKYIDSLPPCYLNDPSITTLSEHPQISHTILRSINSLLSRLPLLTPSTPIPPATSGDQYETSAYTQQSTAEASDVALVELLGTLGSALQSAQAMGRKAGIVESARSAARKNAQGKGDASNYFGGGGEVGPQGARGSGGRP